MISDIIINPKIALRIIDLFLHNSVHRIIPQKKCFCDLVDLWMEIFFRIMPCTTELCFTHKIKIMEIVDD
jgi:hypothetical protein